LASPNITDERDHKHAVIDAAVAENNTIVAAVAGKRILVLSYVIVASGGAQTLIRWESGAGGTALTGEMDLGDNLALIVPYNPGGCFAPTAVGALLNLQITAATSVDGHISYVEID
jgi:hypothetical protein